MLLNIEKLLVVLLCLLVTTSYALRAEYVNKSHPHPNRVRYYPKKTVFLKADLIDFGCVVFVKQCPKIYKKNRICARHYDGKYQTFENYCLMEYENCNSWRQWSMIKEDKCS